MNSWVRVGSVDENQRFLNVWSGLLQGGGLVLLLFGLSCKLFSWGYCSTEILPLFGRDPRFVDDISLINIPLAMVVLGMGIRVYSPYGWWMVTTLIAVMICFFGFLVWFHVISWPFIEIVPGQWEHIPFLAHPDADAIATTSLTSLLLVASLLYWFSPDIRQRYVASGDASSSSEDQYE